jgi:hypothetical protein
MLFVFGPYDSAQQDLSGSMSEMSVTAKSSKWILPNYYRELRLHACIIKQTDNDGSQKQGNRAAHHRPVH